MSGDPGRPSMTALDAAHWYASLGWHVFPVWDAIDGVCQRPKGRSCDRAGTDDAALPTSPIVDPWGQR
jgi:hypothetical protein